MKTLREYIAQLSESMDPETRKMLNIAKARYPEATDDFGALAALVRKANKHSMDDIKTLGAENDAEEADIDDLEIENDAEEAAIAHDEDRLDQAFDELARLRKQVAALTIRK